MENNSNTETLHICRTCMKELVNKSLFFNLDFTDANTELTIRQKLYDFVPELDLSIVPNPVICYECADIVNSIYKFKSKCLQTQMKIHKYIQHMQQTGNVVDLVEVVQFHRRPYGNFRTEVKTEIFEVNENFKADESIFCDGNTCTEAGKHTESTEREDILPLQKIVFVNVDNNLINYSKLESEEISDSYDGNIDSNNIPQIVNKQDDYIQNADTPDNMYQCGHKTESDLESVMYAKNQHDEIAFKSLSTNNESIKLDLAQDSGSKSNVESHMLKRPFKCPVCEFRSSKKNDVKLHMRIHTGEKPFKCQLCEYKGSRKSSLKLHMRVHTGEKPFKCQICEYRCSHKSNLNIHMLNHIGEKPFKCSVCEYQCSHKSALKFHMRIHVINKPFKCSVCEYQCTKKSNLKCHMRIHTGEKPFKCQTCEYHCSEKSNLKIHMRIHTGEKPFQCSVCKYQCTTNSTLKVHMRMHTNETPFKCSACEYQCRHRNSLKTHMQLHSK